MAGRKPFAYILHPILDPGDLAQLASLFSMLQAVFLLSLLVPLPARCVPGSNDPTGWFDLRSGQDLDTAPQAPLAITNFLPASNDTGVSPPLAPSDLVIDSLTSGPVLSAQASTRPLVMAYYPDWAGDEFSPDKVNFKIMEWIDFAFATLDEDYKIGWDSENAPKILRGLVNAAHASGRKVKLSVGGWTGSKCVISLYEDGDFDTNHTDLMQILLFSSCNGRN